MRGGAPGKAGADTAAGRRTHRVEVAGVPAWVPVEALLGPEAWTPVAGAAPTAVEAELGTEAAADLAARLRGVGLGGRALVVTCEPPLPRAAVRAARLEDARRRRETTQGFTRSGARLDAEGRMSLTPEALGLALAGLEPPGRLFDLGCGAGGNTIAFARRGWRVTAVERDAGRLADARHNAELYGVHERIRWVRDDAARWLADAPEAADPQAVLFVDPPWGADWDRLRCGLDAFPLLCAVLAARGGRAVWAKLPPSFDPATLGVPSVPRAFFGLARGDARRVKFVLVRTPAGA